MTFQPRFRQISFLLLSIFFSVSSSGQRNLDSLRDQYNSSPANPAYLIDFAEALLPDSTEEARKLAQSAIGIAGTNNDLIRKARAEFVMGDAWWYDQEFLKAARWFGSSAETYLQEGDLLMAANGYNDMAYALNQIDRYDETLEAYRKSMDLLLKIDDEENLPAVLINIGQVHQKLGQIDSAIFYNEQGVSLTNFPGSEEEYSAALNNLGFIYKNMGNFEKAIAYYTRAYDVSKKMGMQTWISTDLNNIANVYAYWGKYDQAKIYLQQSAEIAKTQNDRAALEITLNNLAYVYQETGNLDSALMLYRQSAEIAEDLGRYGNLAVRKINMGLLYYQKGDYDTAAKYVKEGLETNRKLGIKLSVSGALLNLGTIYLAKGDTKQSGLYLDEALETAQELNARIILEKVYEARSKLFEKTGDYKRSLENYRKFIILKDSVFSEQSQEKLAEMQARYETEKKQQQIELLLKDNQLQKTELRKNQIKLFSLIGGVAILAISALIIWLMYVQKARANRTLVEKNLELMKRDENPVALETETIARPGVSDAEESRILRDLEKIVKADRVFTRKQITLADLAAQIQTNTSYLSRIINEHYKMNFSNFLNLYRIREAQRMFAGNLHLTMTLEGIADSIGFQSRSTFNTAFKKITGVTPSVYLKNLKEIKDEK
jgi:tetratricopeptide (TPR) repeat protein